MLTKDGKKARRTSPFSVPGFRGLWLAHLTGGASLNLALFVVSVVLTLTLGEPALIVGLVIPLSNAGALLFGMVAGVYVDRWGQRTTMLGSVLVRLLAFAAPLVCWVCGVLAWWQLLLAVIAVSVADTFYRAAESARMPLLVGRERVPDATAAMQVPDQVLGLAVPTAAGALVKWLPAPLVLGLSALLQAIGLIGVTRIPRDPARPPRHERQPLLPAVREGVSYLANTRLLGAIVLAALTNNFAAGLYASAESVFVFRDLGMSTLTFGLLMGVSSLGGVAGVMAAPRLGRAIGSLRTLFIGAALMPVNFALIPLAAVWPHAQLALLGVSFVLFGISTGLFGVSSIGLMAQLTPPRLMARVSSTRRTFTQGVVVLGGLLGAAGAGAFGTLVPLWTATALAVLQIIPLLLIGVPRRGAPSAAEIDAAQDEIIVPAAGR